MPEILENVTNILLDQGDLWKNELFRQSFTVNKNHFYKKLDEFVKQGFIEFRKEGNRIMVSLSSPDEKISTFIKDFGKRVEIYEKELKKHFVELQKNIPLINPEMPMKKVKGKTPKLELDKKDNTWKDKGKYQNDHSLRTWNIRKKPLKQLDAILELLNTIYQESSVLNFETDIISDHALLHKYQAKTQKIIKYYIRELEDLFRNTTDWFYFVWKFQHVMHSLVYRASLKAKMNSTF
ncbi:MAG: hypothetical protein HQ505_00215 [Nitrosopumilus sp.]|nr:hypothetical protein [Nitrosopumilus sp.]